MHRYITLLRGINVGGHRPLKMEELRAMFTSMNLKNVATYIQSGNAIFDGKEQDSGQLAKQIAAEIEETFGYDLPVIVLTVDEVREACDRLPFEEKGDWKGYISFLSDDPPEQKKEELENLSNEIEQFVTGDRLVYCFVDKSSEEKPRFSNNFIEKQLGVSATTRNLRTVRKLLEMTGG